MNRKETKDKILKQIYEISYFDVPKGISPYLSLAKIHDLIFDYYGGEYMLNEMFNNRKKIK